MMCRVVLSCLVIMEISSTFVAERIECGRRKWKTVYLIRHGNDALVGQWPWHAAIFHLEGIERKYACGGSVIDHNTILTAAHCVFGAYGAIQVRNISVQLGRVELKAQQDYMQSLDVRKIIVHPKFSHYSIAHDIALIKLYDNITMSNYIQPVCIWNMEEKESIIGTNGTIVGFGLTENDTVSDRLKYATVSVLDPLECISSDREVFGSLLTSAMICGLGQNGVSACNGDSGGGMFFEINGKWFVRGMVSFTPGRANNRGLCDGHKSTVFTDVKKYVEWIAQYIDARVLHDESEVIVDYDEKMKLFNFATCGTNRFTYNYIGTVKKQSYYESGNLCSAVAVSQRYAASSAHCFPNHGVRYEIAFMFETKQIQSIIIHPKFDGATYANDIALIRLLHPIETTSHITPICLPVTSEMRMQTYDNLFLPPAASNIPFQLYVTYLSNSECKAKYTFARSIHHSSQFCVESAYNAPTYLTYDGKPLFQKRTRGIKQQLFLRGVPSLSYATNSSIAFVINDVNRYMDWLLYNMQANEPEETSRDRTSLRNDSVKRKLKRKPDKRLRKIFPNNNCGKHQTFFSKSHRYPPSFPWMGWLQVNRKVSLAELRSDAIATLIHVRFALAAAVTMNSSREWRFVTFGAIGSYFACKTGECNDFIQTLDIREVTVHPNYTKSPRRNDMALIELWPEIHTRHPFIRPICLPWTEDLRSRKPMHLAVITTTLFLLLEKQLQRVNSTNCRQRSLVNGYQVEESDISICAIYSDGQEPAVIVPGAPLHDENILHGVRRYVLSGLSYDLTNIATSVGVRTNNMFYIPLLFTDINNYLDWILEEAYRVYSVNFKLIKNVTLKERQGRTNQVQLSPMRRRTKNRLFNFNTCGKGLLSKNYITHIPWLGVMHPTGHNRHKCAVILISDWYGISTASCAANFTGKVALSRGKSVTRLQQVILHSDYRPGNLNKNIALVKLAKPARSFAKICLPIVDEIRTLGYKRSQLKTFVSKNPFQNQPAYRKSWFSDSVENRYVNPVYCEIYRNESKPKHKRHDSKPLNVRSTVCIQNDFIANRYGMESLVEGSPMFSRHKLNGVKRYFLRGISLRSGTMAHTASMFYLEIDPFLEWLLDNMNNTLHG